jgi:hypothetical protein
MGVISDLVRAVAEIEGLNETAVGVFARAAREAGFITHKGRGRHAAQMTLRDGANLLIAANASALAKDVPDVISRLSALRPERADVLSSADQFSSINSEETRLGQAIETLLEMCLPREGGGSEMQDALEATIRQVDRRRAAKEGLSLGKARVEIKFHHPAMAVEIAVKSPIVLTSEKPAWVFYANTLELRYVAEEAITPSSIDIDRSDTVLITHRTLMRVAQALAT